MALLVALMTFIAVATVFSLLWLLLGTESSQGQIRSRIEAVRKAERRGEMSLDLQLVRDEVFSGVPILNRLMMRLSWSKRLQDLITQAGMDTRPGKVLLTAAVCGLAVYVISVFFAGEILVSLLMAFAGFAVPFVVVYVRRERRLRQFEELFPEALDLLGRAVRAGHAFITGLEMVATESAEPVGGEFRTTFEEQNFGLPLRDALLNMAERVPSVDMRFFITALLVQKDTGGNLAEILDELARVIRERFRIQRDVRVKTAQGRLTAAILIGLPIGMLVMMKIANPTYIGLLFADRIGRIVLTAAAVLQIIGAAIIWKIVQVEV